MPAHVAQEELDTSVQKQSSLPKGGSPPLQECGGDLEVSTTLRESHQDVDNCKHDAHSDTTQADASEENVDKGAKGRKVNSESFLKVCEFLRGRKVRVWQKTSEDAPADERGTLVEGHLRQAQGRSTVKILTSSDEIVLIRLQDVHALEAPDGTYIVHVHTPETASEGKSNVSAVPQSEGKPQNKTSSSREKVLPGGLKYQIEQAGRDGAPVAVNGSEVQVYYDGRLAQNGSRFDKGTLKFQLGSKAVVKGFDLGVQGMVVGEKRKISIPWKMAYGAEGCPPQIPPRADLVFSVQLNAVM